MGGNLPPGVSPGDPNAPWNQPDITDLLPLVCDKRLPDGDPCGFRAETVDELDRHRHDKENFVRPEPDRPDYCFVCNPPPDMGKRFPRDGGEPAFVFCDNHDRDDWKAKMEHDAKRRREARERELDHDEHQRHMDG